MYCWPENFTLDEKMDTLCDANRPVRWDSRIDRNSSTLSVDGSSAAFES